MLVGSFASVFGPVDDASRALVRCVCPLFVLKRKGEPFLIGSGVPVQIGRVSVIVTAAHVLSKYGGVSVLTLGNSRAMVLTGERRGFGHRPDGSTVDVDLALIVLSDQERDQIRSLFTFSYSSAFAPTGSSKHTFFVVVGYPQSRNKLSPRLKMQGKALANYFISRSQMPLLQVDSADKSASTHFVIGASADGAIALDGAPAPFPALSGISGGGIWRLYFSPNPAALPTARLVGIGIEYCRSPGAFVCTRIEHVLTMVTDLAG